LAISNPIVRQVCSSLEAPSAVAGVRDAFPDVSISFSEVPEPDPRVAWQPVPFVLWRYDGTAAHAAVGEPPAEVTAVVTALAAQPYSLAHWSEAARAAASNLASVPSAQIAATMVNPPPAPIPTALGEWRFRVQVATALLVSHVEELHRRSPREFLRHLVHGPVDWVTSAAIIGYLDIARRRPDGSVSIAEELLRLAVRPASPIWFSCGAYPALLAVADVPGLDATLYASVRRTLEEWSAE
jgi:hypothetical protein